MPSLTGPNSSNSATERLRAAITNPPTSPDGTTVPSMGDKYGRQVVALGTPGDLVTDSGSPLAITDSSEHTILSAVANTFLDLTAILIGNNTAGTVVVNVKDSTGGTTRLTFVVPAGATQGISLTRPRYQTTANSNWTATVGSGAGSTVYVWAQAELRV